MILTNSRRDFRVAPDQFFSAGFRDGMSDRPLHPQFCNHPDYLNGYLAGYRLHVADLLQTLISNYSA